MLVSLTVGKVDAGVTVLLTQDKRLIEFPSILLPQSISSGSIVDITVARNSGSERDTEAAFQELQNRIFNLFGAQQPETPVLRCLNATQTSVVLEWDPIQLATADLISLALYRNGQKAGNIPRPLQMHSTKISGLAVDTEYSFHLVLRTTAGTMSSEKVVVKTHKMTDLSGITITTGILPPTTRQSLTKAVERIGAKMMDNVRIDTTHFVTTEGRGIVWEKAVESNIPVVRPEWIEACERSGRILGVTKFYLDAMRPVLASEASATSSAAVPAPLHSPLSGYNAGTETFTRTDHAEIRPPENADESSPGEGDMKPTSGDSPRQDKKPTEDIAVSQGDNQKVRFEADQKVGIRLGPMSGKGPNDAGCDEQRNPQTSPEGSSFQEVEL